MRVVSGLSRGLFLGIVLRFGYDFRILEGLLGSDDHELLRYVKNYGWLFVPESIMSSAYEVMIGHPLRVAHLTCFYIFNIFYKNKSTILHTF